MTSQMFSPYFPPFFQLPPAKAPPNRRVFTADEDVRLKDLVARYGEKSWANIASKMGTRSARQCRERYKDYLHPDILNAPWRPEEDLLLRTKYAELGPKWAQMTVFFDKRSPANLKNHWVSLSARDQTRPLLPIETEEVVQPQPPVEERGEEEKRLMPLWGLNLTVEDWESDESKLLRWELRKCFPNHAGERW
jgi:hypothetical protein